MSFADQSQSEAMQSRMQKQSKFTLDTQLKTTLLNVFNLFGMAYRNQRHGEFMDESSIFLELNGLSSGGMALGKVLGFARDERTKTHQKHNIASNHLKRAKDMACEAIKKVK